MSATAPAVKPRVGLRMLEGLVSDLQAVRSHIAVLQAQEAELFAWAATVIAVREDERDGKRTRDAVAHGSQLAVREVHAELAAALRLSEYSIARRIDNASTLFDRFPATRDALVFGHIDSAHADVIVDAGSVLTDDEMRAAFERTALDWAATETPARLRALVTDLVTRMDPDGTEVRVQDAATRRSVWVKDTEPGMACLGVNGPAAHIHGIFDRLTQMAKEQQAMAKVGSGSSSDAATPNESAPDHDPVDEPADERSLAQLRADIAADLLLTGIPTGHGATSEERAALGAIRGVVHIEMPASTLTGATLGGATIPGHGPIDADTARHLAATASTWTRVFRSPDSRVPYCVDTYRPSKKQRRLLKARDVHCRFPGCRRPARSSDLDHTFAFAEGGRTALDNLAHLCRRHHTLKHETAWTVEQLPGGVLRWSSPARRIHYDRPSGTVQFIDTELDEPPPF